LKKRDNFRKAFANFVPEKVAEFDEKMVEKLLQNDGIIRNRKKIEATIKNSREFLRIVEEFGSFDNYIWGFVNGKPVVNNWRESEKLPAETPLSKKISVDLKKRGFLFVGPIVVYSYMQAVGIVEDHYEYCFRKGEI